MQERDHIPERKTLLLVIASIVAIVASAVAARVVLAWQASELHGRDSEQTPQELPRERSGIEQTPTTDDGALLDFTAQRETLESYGWVDREHGVVHVPIDKAIHDFIEQEVR